MFQQYKSSNNKVLKLISLFLILEVFAFSSCIRIPKEHFIVSQRKVFASVQDSCGCNVDQFEDLLVEGVLANTSEDVQEIDAGGFQLMNWNILKGKKNGWEKDFKRLSDNIDILIIQEAQLTDELREILNADQYNWDISIAYKYKGLETGVLTASKEEPVFICTLRSKEPFFKVPKTVLITLYAISGTDQMLMVVNIHSINFTFGTSRFLKQLEEVEKILLQHQGPMIISGDINTWTKKRVAVMENLFYRLGLSAVTFAKNNRVKIFGLDIDHIYYRGLVVKKSVAVKVGSSDHNPMLVDFMLKNTDE